MSRKIVIKYDYPQSWEISSNTTLLEFGLVKSNLRQLSWPKEKFKEDFLNMFHFIFLFSLALFKRSINNKLTVILVTSASYFLSYSVILYCSQFSEGLWDHGGATLRNKSWTSNAKIKRRLIPSGKPRAVDDMDVFMVGQTDVVNKQLVSPLSWNNPLSETSVGKWYILIIYRPQPRKIIPWMLRKFITCNCM